MDCTFIKMYLDAYERGQLAEDQEKGIGKHLAICRGCANEFKEIQAVNAMLDEIQIPSPSKDFTLQVMAGIRESELWDKGKNGWQEFGKWGASFVAAGLIMLLLNFTSFGSEITTYIANIDRNPIKANKIMEYSPVNIVNKGLEHIHQILENLENRR